MVKQKNGKAYNNISSEMKPLNAELKKIPGLTEEVFAGLTESLKGISEQGIVAILGLTELDEGLKNFIIKMDLAKTATDKSTWAIIKQTAAKIKSATINYAARLTSTGSDATTIGASLASVLALGWTKIKEGFLAFFAKLKSFFIATLPFWKALGNILLAVVKPLLVVLGWIVAAIGVFVIVFDTVTMAINKLRGIQTTKGTITRWFAELIYSTDTSEMQNVLAERKKRFQQANKDWGGVLKELEDRLQPERFNRMIENMLPQQAIVELQKKYQEVSDTHKKYNDQLAGLKNDFIKASLIDNADERKKAQQTINNKIKEVQDKIAEAEQKRYEVEDKLKEKQQQLIQAQIAFTDKLDDIKKSWFGMREAFSYGYKDGKFGKYSDQVKQTNNQYRILELQQRLHNKQYRNAEEQEKFLNEIFDLQKQNYEFQLDSLYKQREAAITNLKSMNEFVKQAYQFKSTTQSAVSADSTQAVVLQSRQRDGMTKNEYAPIVEQQKAIKEIENKMLNLQQKGQNVLSQISNTLISLANKMPGNTGGTSNITVVAP